MNKRSIWYLAVAEILVWAGMFYSFPALILRWETDQGWSKTQLSATFTIALIVSAFSAPLAGHLIDRGYGRMVLTGSALIGGLMVAALCVIEQFGFFFHSLAGAWFRNGWLSLRALFRLRNTYPRFGSQAVDHSDHPGGGFCRYSVLPDREYRSRMGRMAKLDGRLLHPHSVCFGAAVSDGNRIGKSI